MVCNILNDAIFISINFMIIRAICSINKKNIGGINMLNFNNVKKFARENRHKFIICGIVVALTGAFLAWLVNVAFLAMIILSFIWTGYFYFLGTEQPLNKNKTNDIQNCKQSKNELQVSKDIKLENDLKSTEPQPQKQENVIINENNNIQESQKFPEYQVQKQENIIINENKKIQVTKKSVYSKVFQYLGYKELGYKNYTDVSSIYPVNSYAACEARPIIAIVKIHLQDIQLHEYSLDQIISYVINIIGILTGTEVSNINQYLDEYRSCNNMEDKNKLNHKLTVTKDIEKVIGKFSCFAGEARYKIDIEHLDKLIQKIIEQYRTEFENSKQHYPNLEATSQLIK